MAAVSVVKKLQRCERIHGRRDDLSHVVKYKIKIKDGVSASNSISINSNYASLPAAATKVIAELTEALVHDSPAAPFSHGGSHQSSPYICLQEHDLLQHALQPRPLFMSDGSLQGLATDACGFKPASNAPSALLREAQALQPGSAPKWSLPWKQLTGKAEEDSEDEEEGVWEMLPWKLNVQSLEEEGACDGSLQQPQKKSSAGKRSSEEEREDEVAEAWQAALKGKKQEKRGEGEEWGVKKMECECCGMEEECTEAYEERVRAELGGHWLCGLCEEAVREERKRLGGRLAGGEAGLQMALQAHMQPCRHTCSRARAKASPPPSDVAVPHAVCRLLRRHLSTPSASPRDRPSPPRGLPRSASCLATFSPRPQP